MKVKIKVHNFIWIVLGGLIVLCCEKERDNIKNRDGEISFHLSGITHLGTEYDISESYSLYLDSLDSRITTLGDNSKVVEFMRYSDDSTNSIGFGFRLDSLNNVISDWWDATFILLSFEIEITYNTFDGVNQVLYGFPPDNVTYNPDTKEIKGHFSTEGMYPTYPEDLCVEGNFRVHLFKEIYYY
jgi:hypothetical protein